MASAVAEKACVAINVNMQGEADFAAAGAGVGFHLASPVYGIWITPRIEINGVLQGYPAV